MTEYKPTGDPNSDKILFSSEGGETITGSDPRHMLIQELFALRSILEAMEGVDELFEGTDGGDAYHDLHSYAQHRYRWLYIQLFGSKDGDSGHRPQDE